MRIVAFLTSKGGVGKTTFLLHLAALCAQGGLRVLVADADPQRNASFHSLETGALRGLRESALRRALRDDEELDPAPFVMRSPHFGFDILPGDTSLLEVLPRLEAAWSRGDAQAMLRMRRLLLRLHRGYDIAFLDLAPGPSALAKAGLIAADGFVTAFGMSAQSLDGLRASRDWILHWEPHWRTALGARPRGGVRARFLGGLANRVSIESPAHRTLIEGAGRLTRSMARDLDDHVPGASYILGAAPDFGPRTLAAQLAKRPIFAEAAPESREIFARAARRLLDGLGEARSFAVA
ncbi:ParA family protein [Neomegalonema sp.]|uniref:ParA family protein n=1 Tax=Neomegalonema sp. TaxID=2039713 RepID=UPI0026397995|nr:ParA family protein [Neomegalonema sp.]MDD2867529.1 ParA family protein [Neomegalonema sp.]